MQEMSKTIARLRLLLASIKGKEEELSSTRRQFQRQLEGAPNFAIQGNPLDATLSIMSEIQERLDDADVMREHIEAIRARAEAELEALELTNKIEQAKSDLATLKAREDSGDAGEPERQEIQELERFIKEASLRAGQAITGESADGRARGLAASGPHGWAC